MSHRPVHSRPVLPRPALPGLALCAAVVGWLAAAVAGAQDTVYLTRLPDLPLMQGLTEVADAGVAFDKPSGRIVESYAEGEASAAEVRAFYRETLPQLGWTALGADSYLREGERLSLEVGADAGRVTVHFTLSPQ